MSAKLDDLIERLESHMGLADRSGLLRDCHLAAGELRRLSALRPASTGDAEGWRDIASAPSGQWVLTCLAGERGVNLCVCREGEWCDQSGRTTVTHHSMAAPTHWMPCPKPPSAMIAAAGGENV